MIYIQVALVLAGGFLFPWWWIMLVGLGVGWYFQPRYPISRILVSGLLTGLMTWGVFAYYFDLRSAGLVSERLSRMFGLPFTSATYLITGGVAGLCLMFSAWLGAEARCCREKSGVKSSLRDLNKLY